MCAARKAQDAGSATPKRIGLAVGLLSTGAMLPSMLQYAGAPSASACHCGALRVTAETGSPMALTGIADPSFAAVQSASVISFTATETCAAAVSGQESRDCQQAGTCGHHQHILSPTRRGVASGVCLVTVNVNVGLLTLRRRTGSGRAATTARGASRSHVACRFIQILLDVPRVAAESRAASAVTPACRGIELVQAGPSPPDPRGERGLGLACRLQKLLQQNLAGVNRVLGGRMVSSSVIVDDADVERVGRSTGT